MTRPAVTYPDPERLIVDLLTDELDDVTVGVDLPAAWTPRSAPHVQVAWDGTPAGRHPITLGATIRVVAWAATKTAAKALALEAHGRLCAYTGGIAGLVNVLPLTGPLTAVDPDHDHAELFIAGQRGSGLEVGNVLGHYGYAGHRVVDLYEPGAGVDNIDLFDVTDRFDWVVSISTVEHVRWDRKPRDPDAAVAAVLHLTSLAPAALITVPLGHHPHLDEAIRDGSLNPTRDCVFIRSGDGWEQRTRRTWRPYGATTPWAEAVWIAEWRP